MTPVPLLDPTRENDPLLGELTAAARRVLESGRYVLGPEVEAFEEAVSDLHGGVDGLFVASGTDALLLALMACGVGPGDEVLVPSFTFFATAGCVARVGARPVFVDACPLCFNLDVEDAARKAGPRTRAIIPVHLFGQAAEMDGILELARARGLRVIEDAAQAIGARYRGRTVGTMGDCAAISYFPTKNLGGFGEGGHFLSRDPGLLERARILRVHGMEPKYHHSHIGGNFRGDPLQAALLAVKLPHLAAGREARARNAAAYEAAFSTLPGAGTADPSDCACHPGRPAATPPPGTLRTPVIYPHNETIWNQYTLLAPGRRDALLAHLRTTGIGCEVYYPVPLHRQPCFAALDPDPCPVAEELAAACLSLPIFPGLREGERQRVIEAVRGFFGAG